MGDISEVKALSETKQSLFLFVNILSFFMGRWNSEIQLTVFIQSYESLTKSFFLRTLFFCVWLNVILSFKLAKKL